MHVNGVSLAFNNCASPLASSGASPSGCKADSFADPSSNTVLQGFLISSLSLRHNLVNLLVLQARSPNHSGPFTKEPRLRTPLFGNVYPPFR
jgi:hypothetical protein